MLGLTLLKNEVFICSGNAGEYGALKGISESHKGDERACKLSLSGDEGPPLYVEGSLHSRLRRICK